jgi:ABC-type multidrug transport system ATPase subunit
VVDDFSLTMYKDEILVLLGHNGAGKTTTLSMLTGLVQPNRGSAFAFGRDLLGDTRNLTDFIGVCPQDNVLLEKLTTYDNLEFFAKFKGIEDSDIPQVVNANLEKFNLLHKRDSQVSYLSGGQKRKLQLAIALMGDA